MVVPKRHIYTLLFVFFSCVFQKARTYTYLRSRIFSTIDAFNKPDGKAFAEVTTRSAARRL